jgi:hypothetical protein
MADTKATKKPVFVIGCPRSGTTLLLDLLAAHEAFAWVSHYTNHLSRLPIVDLLNLVYEVPVLGRKLFRWKRGWPFGFLFLPHPVEPWLFLSLYLKNFRYPNGEIRNPSKDEITVEERRRIQRRVRWLCSCQKKDRFLSKYTDFPRMRYIIEAFGDTQFIHIIRDGHAVSYSYYRMLKTGEFGNWQDRDRYIRAWPEKWRKAWKQKYRSMIAFCAYQWMFFVKEIQREAQCLPADRYYEVRYEELVESSMQVLCRILKFLELPVTKKFEALVKPHLPLRNMNLKWRDDLTKEQKEQLSEILKGYF